MVSTIVLDCSVTVAWLLEDEASEAADELLDQAMEARCMAPNLWWAEIRNVLIISERRGRVTPEEIEAGLRWLNMLDIRLDRTPDSAAVLRLARGHRLSVYDAMYLELALREGGLLATFDRKLAGAARAEGVETLGGGQ